MNKKHENKKKVWRNILPVACANVKRQNPKMAANRLEFVSFPAHAQKRQVFLESEHLKRERERAPSAYVLRMVCFKPVNSTSALADVRLKVRRFY